MPLRDREVIMRGFSLTLKMLESDLQFEKDAVTIYKGFAEKAHDPQIRELFQELTKAEYGHVNGLKSLTKTIKDGEHEVKFYCPVCGWEVNFGETPGIGDRARCRMCGVIFELTEIGGDYDIRRV